MDRLCPSKAVTRLAWRPRVSDSQNPRDKGSTNGDQGRQMQLAVASSDCSVRLFSIFGLFGP